MGRNHLCEQAIPKDPVHLLLGPCSPSRPSGLSLGFPRLSPSRRQLDYVLLARPPLYSPCGFHVRLACLIHAANVRSEPGSNPSLEKFVQLTCRLPYPTNFRRLGRGLSAALHPTRRSRAKPGEKRGNSRSHAFFRGHPECQRSLARSPLAPERGGEKVARDRMRSRSS